MAESVQKRTARILARADLLDVICIHVSNGGTLIELAKQFDIQFGSLSNWIHADKERNRRYLAALNDRGEWSQERVLQELRMLGLSDIRVLFHENGSLKPVTEWPEEIARAVASIEVFEEFAGSGEDKAQIGWTKKVKFWDKTRALELVGKNLKLFTDKIENSTTVKLEDLVRDPDE